MKEEYGAVNLQENEVKIFEFDEQHGVETIYLNGEPLFNPYDIGRCLNIPDGTIRRHLAEMDDDERIILSNSNVHDMNIRKLANRGEGFLKEAGMYHLIFESRRPEAKKFKKWVTNEVLPSIRKTGSYSIKNQEQMLQTVIQNTEILLGVRRREIAIFQNETPNKKLSNLMVDCARQGMGHMKDLYNELYYIFEAETGIDLPEIAELKGMRIRDYLKKNQTVAQTLYEFAYNHFKGDTRQIILIPLDKDQKSLDGYIKNEV